MRSMIIRQHTWSIPVHNEEIQRWNESGDFSALTQFQKRTCTEALVWHSGKRRLEVTCPSAHHLFHLSKRSTHELAVEQNGMAVWSLYFDAPCR